MLGGGLKVKQKLTGRLADALSELYFLCCLVKRFEDDGRPAADRPIVALAAANGLARFEEALRGTIENFPNAPARAFLRVVVFPFGRHYYPATDALASKVVRAATEPGELRDRLTRHIFVSSDPDDPTGLLEVTLKKVVAAEEAEKKLERAIRAGTVRRYHGIDWIADAAEKGIVTESEAQLLREVEALTARVIAVDHFDPRGVEAQLSGRESPANLGHNSRALGQRCGRVDIGEEADGSRSQRCERLRRAGHEPARLALLGRPGGDRLGDLRPRRRERQRSRRAPARGAVGDRHAGRGRRARAHHPRSRPAVGQGAATSSSAPTSTSSTASRPKPR